MGLVVVPQQQRALPTVHHGGVLVGDGCDGREPHVGVAAAVVPRQEVHEVVRGGGPGHAGVGIDAIGRERLEPGEGRDHGTEPPPQQVDLVRPVGAQQAAATRGERLPVAAAPPVARGPPRRGVGDVRVQHLTDLSGGDPCGHAAAVGVEAELVSDQADAAAFGRAGAHRLRLGRAHGGRLLAQDVGAGVQGRERHGRVQVGWGRDADQVELVVAQQRTPVVAGVWHVERMGRGAGALETGAGDRHHPRAGDVAQGGQVGGAGEAAADDADADGHGWVAEP
jgi:hypothetical protein